MPKVRLSREAASAGEVRPHLPGRGAATLAGMQWTWGRAQRLAAVALAPLSLVFVVLRCVSPATPFLSSHAGAEWIMASEPVNARLHQWGSDDVPRVRFSATLPDRGDERPADATARSGVLRLRAFGAFEVSIDGVPLPNVRAFDPKRWREELRIDVPAGAMRSGALLEVTVRNAVGPGLLWARLQRSGEDDVALLATGTAWRANVDGGIAGAALIADDTRENPAAYGGVAPARAFTRERDTLLGVFVLGGLAALALSRFGWVTPGRLPMLSLGLAAVVWLVYLGRFVEVPFDVGFDARNHQAYVDHLREQRSLPLATDGWSMFHPPLFHLGAALLQELAESLGAPDAPLARRAIGFLSGVVSVLAVFGIARSLFRDRPVVQAVAVLFAALLPVHVYSSAYFSNEALHTALASLAVWMVVRALMLPEVTPRAAVAVGAALGLALLAKFTSAVLVPLSLFFVAAKVWAVERRGAAAVARSLGAIALPVVALAGWYYARNAWVLGDPFMTNWDDVPGSGRNWWQQPGFHTIAYFTSFGASLSHPFLSGFESFWDSVYSTFWGDGFVAGRVNPAQRHPVWNYDYMALSYWVGVPGSVLLGWGTARAIRGALGDSDPRRRVALTFLATLTWAVGLGFVVLVLEAPFYSQAKAAYGLVALGPLAAFFALGCEACSGLLAARGGRGWRELRTAYYAGCVTFWFVLFRAFAG